MSVTREMCKKVCDDAIEDLQNGRFMDASAKLSEFKSILQKQFEADGTFGELVVNDIAQHAFLLGRAAQGILMQDNG